MGRRAGLVLLGFLLAMVTVASLFSAGPAQAKTFTVNYKGDATDDEPGDGSCNAGLGLCSLRAAIEEANAFAGENTIGFDIPSAGVQTIKPGSELPLIMRRVTIDGYTQPGAKRNTIEKGATNATLLIELDGTNAGSSAAGLRLGGSASNTVIRGLVINRFDIHGIYCCNSVTGNVTGIKVVGNFIGTNAAGTSALGNGFGGVALQNPRHTIGGTTPSARNLISGNGSRGVSLFGAGSTVAGNLIGTDKNGTGPLGNGGGGVGIGGKTTSSGVTLPKPPTLSPSTTRAACRWIPALAIVSSGTPSTPTT